MAEEKTIQAVIERVAFNKDGYVIAKAREIGRNSNFSVLGKMATVEPGQLYEFTGSWSKNSKYNSFDFKFKLYKTVKPTTTNGIYEYLIHIGKWVGPSTANALLKEFGDSTLEVIKKNPETVIEKAIPGLTRERVAELSKSLNDNEAREAVMIETSSLIGDVLGSYAVDRAISTWGFSTAAIVKSNPFRLTKLAGVGFIRADSVDKKLGGKPDRLRRHTRALIYALEERCSSEGHTRVNPLVAMTDLAALVQPTEIHKRAVEACRRAKLVSTFQDDYVLASYFNAEKYIAETMKDRMYRDGEHSELKFEGDRKVEFERIRSGLEGDQLAAFDTAMKRSVMILTGAPGTGKTYTMARILEAWALAGVHYEIAAPTGKAAKQMTLALSRTIGGTAQTIHSLLEVNMSENSDTQTFARNQNNQLTCSGIVIDETSMLDTQLGAAVLKAINRNCRILFIGDHYQLPSVGPGAVLRDMINAGVPNVELKTIRRNSGLIVQACHAIKDGHLPSPAAKLTLADNWRHLEVESDKDVLHTIRVLIEKKVSELSVDRIWQTQVISPTNSAGLLSCDALNVDIKGVVNPGNEIGKLPFSIGDKIVRTKNGMAESCDSSEEIRIVNGDIGIVKDATDKEIIVEFMFPVRRVKLPRNKPHIQLAYCLTCHKMQGSESDLVILPLGSSMKIPMVTREWFYTAISRAKKYLITVGSLSHVSTIARRIGIDKRQTTLCEQIKSA